MLTLPFVLTSLIVGFAPLFSEPAWEHVQVLLVGAILAPGKRTVTSALRVVGLSRERHFQDYHRVLNRAVWSSLPASRILIGLLVGAFAPAGPLVFAIDEHDPSGGAARGSKPRASTATRCARRTPTSSKRAGCGGCR